MSTTAEISEDEAEAQPLQALILRSSRRVLLFSQNELHVEPPAGPEHDFDGNPRGRSGRRKEE
jgi:hypothetical protein